MNTYYITVSGNVCGYDVELAIDADTEQEAKEIALQEAQDIIRRALNTLHIARIEED